MAEDFRRLQNQLMLSEKDILQKVLEGINDTLESLGRDINMNTILFLTPILLQNYNVTQEAEQHILDLRYQSVEIQWFSVICLHRVVRRSSYEILN
ncbi:hypothetical protein LIER_30814 [Lithospermum erythrorhizon]|uniref:Uncharacterized protein n=1 Tax=Lithospermum erythrorhizon TaxID=34254 RepID=A0AAV3RQU1_LITER